MRAPQYPWLIVRNESPSIALSSHKTEAVAIRALRRNIRVDLRPVCRVVSLEEFRKARVALGGKP